MVNEIFSWVKAHRLVTVIIGGLGCLSFGGVILVALLHPPVATPPMPDAALGSQAVRQQTSSGSSKGSAKAVAKANSGPLYVDVKGAVKQPGLYQVRTDMRVADALTLAQGMLPQADQVQVNLAAKVTDQQVIYVPVKGEKPPTMPVPPTTAPTHAGTLTTSQTGTNAKPSDTKAVVNLNTADVATLQKLSGVGQKKAEKIIAYREQHGGFKSVADLKKVGGFGDKTLAKFKDQLTV